jgi:isocitrate dehydrogenase
MDIKHTNPQAAILAKTLDLATEKLLDENKSPSRKTGELDNRGSHFYLCMYWAQELSAQTEDTALAQKFTELAKTLAANEAKIIEELTVVQGSPAGLDGYYHATPSKIEAIMRPSATLNAAFA